jgi:hypothetical protein
MSLNLNAEQRQAHARAYRQHHLRLYRLHERADGSHVLVVKFEHPDDTRALPPRLGKLRLHENAVTVEFFDPTVSPHLRDADHLQACVIATLNAYAHRGLPLSRAFDYLSDPEGSSSLPVVMPEVLAA